MFNVKSSGPPCIYTDCVARRNIYFFTNEVNALSVHFSVSAIVGAVLVAVALVPRPDLPPRLRLESCQSEQNNRRQTDHGLSRNSRLVLVLHNLHCGGKGA